MSTRPAQSSATVGRHRDLRLQAEVDLVELHPDVGPYAAGAAVRADHRARQHASRRRDSTTATVRRSGTAEPCCSTRETVTPVRSSAPAFCACSTSCCVELGPVDQPEEHLLGTAGPGQLAVQRERHRVHPVRSGSSKPGGSASREGPMMPPPHVL